MIGDTVNFQLPFEVVPLLIQSPVHGEWKHPFIDTWFHPNTEDGYDLEVFRTYFENDKGETLYVIYKCPEMMEFVDEYFATQDWENNSNGEFFEFVQWDRSLEGLYLTLFEDFWSPYPNHEGVEIKNSKEYEAFRSMYPSEQFLFSEYGAKINSDFGFDSKITLTSPDVGLKKEETTYSWSS